MKKLLLANAAGGHRRPSQVFADFCETAAISMRNAVQRGDGGFSLRESRYAEIMNQYTPVEVDRFAEILARLVIELEQNPRDVLGDLYMSLDLGNEHTGQFFTPNSVSDLMAAVTLRSTPVHLPDGQDFIRLHEPTCGSGGMVIAFAKQMREQGLNYQRQLHVTAQDIDIIPVHMAYVQLTLLGIPAVINHGNTLTLEVFDSWPTLGHVFGGWDARLTAKKAATV